MNFGENLLKYRKMKGFTQEVMADKLQISRQSVSKWENGEAIPDLYKIIKISEILDVSIDELCGQNNLRKDGTEPAYDSASILPFKVEKTQKNYWLLIVSCILTLVVGYFFGMSIGSSTYRTLKEVDVSSTTFDVERWKLHCEFVPSVFQENFNYTVYMYDSEGNEKKAEVKWKNGIAQATLPIEEGYLYKVILVVNDGAKSKNIVLAERLSVTSNFENIILQ